MQVRDERNVDARKVGVADAELKLPHRLDERRGLNVADGPAELAQPVSETEPKVTSTMFTSMMQMSGSSAVSSTGILATRSTQSWMALVKWGTIYVFTVSSSA
jgi:hypothetical protein